MEFQDAQIGPKRAAEKVATDLSDEVGCWEEIVRALKRRRLSFRRIRLATGTISPNHALGRTHNTTTHQVIHETSF